MSQLHRYLRQYFEEHHRAPEPTSNFYQMLDMALDDEIVPIALEVAAMRIVAYMSNEGKDKTPEQQVEGVEPYVREAVRLIVSKEASIDWRALS